MKPLSRAAAWLCALVVVAGRASTQVTERQRYQGAKLARPDRIIVYDFTANPADVPPESAFAAQMAGAPRPTAQQIEIGRKLGAEVAKNLVADLQGMGLPAVEAAGQPQPRVDDIVLRGYFVSVDEGSATQRVLVGSGAGAAELKTPVERKVCASLDAAKSSPGVARCRAWSPRWRSSPPPPTRSVWSSAAR